MPNVKSAAKRLRQSLQARLRNRSDRSTMRTAVKKLETALEQGNLEDARRELPGTVSSIDRLAKKGIIHPNNASRHISRLSLAVNRLAQGESTGASS